MLDLNFTTLSRTTCDGNGELLPPTRSPDLCRNDRHDEKRYNRSLAAKSYCRPAKSHPFDLKIDNAKATYVTKSAVDLEAELGRKTYRQF